MVFAAQPGKPAIWNLPLAIFVGKACMRSRKPERRRGVGEPCGSSFGGRSKPKLPHSRLRISQDRVVTMEIKSFKNMYLAELQELMSVEAQLAEALPRMAEATSHPALKQALLDHAEETAVQKQRLGSILQKHGAVAQTHTDQAMQALLTETRKMFNILKGDDLRDAGIIASVQKLEHYEIAAYGTAAALAGQLEFRDDQRVLHDSLEEEKKTDLVLTQLAKREVNRDALAV